MGTANEDDTGMRRMSTDHVEAQHADEIVAHLPDVCVTPLSRGEVGVGMRFLSKKLVQLNDAQPRKGRQATIVGEERSALRGKCRRQLQRIGRPNAVNGPNLSRGAKLRTVELHDSRRRPAGTTAQ
jgi:hypothetical protein